MALQILVIEDDFWVGTDLAEILMEAGCDAVGPVGGVDSALTILQARPLDAATLDLHLFRAIPVEPVVAELEARGIPFVIITGQPSADLAGRFPGTMIIRKPYSRHDIRSWVDSLRNGGPAH